MWQDAVANPTAKPPVAVADWAAELDWQALLQDALGKSAARYDLVRRMLNQVMWQALLQDAMGKSAARYNLVRRMLDQVVQPDKDVDSCLSIPE